MRWLDLKARLANLDSSRFFQWDNLATLGDSPLSTVGLYGLVFIPILASLLKLIEVLGASIGLDLSIFLPLPMIAAYTAALLFFCACVLVAIFCPRNVQKYKTFASFESALLEKGANIVAMKKQVQEIKSSEGGVPKAFKIQSPDDYKRFMPGIVEQAVKEDLAEEIEAEIGRASMVWAGLLVKYPNKRLIIGLMFVLAMLTSAVTLVIYLPAVVFGLI